MRQPIVDKLDNVIDALEQMKGALEVASPNTARMFYEASQSAHHDLNEAVVEALGPILDPDLPAFQPSVYRSLRTRINEKPAVVRNSLITEI